MRNFILTAVAAIFCLSINSCQKCSNCVQACQICSQAGVANATPCRTNYASEAEYLAAIQNYTIGGYACVNADETDKVCTSGLFFKLRHQSDIDAKESEGFKCD